MLSGWKIEVSEGVTVHESAAHPTADTAVNLSSIIGCIAARRFSRHSSTAKAGS